jgi:hypothetical protein
MRLNNIFYNRSNQAGEIGMDESMGKTGLFTIALQSKLRFWSFR